MTTQQLNARRLPKIVATGLLGFYLLSTGLLISGCSNSNNVETKPANETTDSSSAVETAKSTDDVAANADVNSIEKENTTAKTDTDIVSHDISPIAAAVKEPSILTWLILLYTWLLLSLPLDVTAQTRSLEFFLSLTRQKVFERDN